MLSNSAFVANSAAFAINNGETTFSSWRFYYNFTQSLTVNGELTVKRISKRDGRLSLMPENGNYEPLQINECTGFEVWGVVTHVIHAVS